MLYFYFLADRTTDESTELTAHENSKPSSIGAAKLSTLNAAVWSAQWSTKPITVNYGKTH